MRFLLRQFCRRTTRVLLGHTEAVKLPIYSGAPSSATATATQRINYIMPRVEALTYSGGETRLVVVDRRASLSSLPSRLSSMLLSGRSFTLKYLTDLSDSAAVNNTLVNLDEPSGGDAEIQNLETNVNGENNKQGDSVANGVISHQEMHMSSLPDCPMMEAAGSSVGSSSSSPSPSNVPPIRVRVSEDQRMEEQFAQMSFSNVQTQRHFDDGMSLMASRPMMIPAGTMTDGAMAYNNAPSDGAAFAASNGQVSPDDDPGVSTSYRKPPRTGGGPGGYGLTSPDSVESDTSISSATSFSKPMYYQDQPPALKSFSRAYGSSGIGPFKYAKTGIFWDTENCCFPNDVRDPSKLLENITVALGNEGYFGEIAMFAIGDLQGEGVVDLYQTLETTGINLVHVEDAGKGLREVSDKKLMVKMIFWSWENHPANVLLISGDAGFEESLQELKKKDCNILCAGIGGSCSPKLRSVGTAVWEWTDLVKGGRPIRYN